MLDTKLGRDLIREVAVSLKKGHIPEEWQLSKVVFIPKPKKDHKATKRWRPIKLINCLGKLAENVVAYELQEAGQFHRGVWTLKSTYGERVDPVVRRRHMCMNIVDWEGKANMKLIETNVKRIFREMVNECRLPLDFDEEEILHMRKSRKKDADRRYVK